MTAKAIKKGARLCYMDESLDEVVSPWDNCKKNEDFDIYDWKNEVQKLSKAQQLALFHSPLGAQADMEEESDSVDSEEYDNDQ